MFFSSFTIDAINVLLLFYFFFCWTVIYSKLTVITWNKIVIVIIKVHFNESESCTEKEKQYLKITRNSMNLQQWIEKKILLERVCIVKKNFISAKENWTNNQKFKKTLNEVSTKFRFVALHYRNRRPLEAEYKMQHHPNSWYMPWHVPLQKLALAVPFHSSMAAVGYQQQPAPTSVLDGKF